MEEEVGAISSRCGARGTESWDCGVELGTVRLPGGDSLGGEYSVLMSPGEEGRCSKGGVDIVR